VVAKRTPPAGVHPNRLDPIGRLSRRTSPEADLVLDRDEAALGRVVVERCQPGSIPPRSHSTNRATAAVATRPLILSYYSRLLADSGYVSGTSYRVDSYLGVTTLAICRSRFHSVECTVRFTRDVGGPRWLGIAPSCGWPSRGSGDRAAVTGSSPSAPSVRAPKAHSSPAPVRVTPVRRLSTSVVPRTAVFRSCRLDLDPVGRVCRRTRRRLAERYAYAMLATSPHYGGRGLPPR